MTKALMVQGTGSDVGKSLIVAGLARAYTRRGLIVRPFKPQNMSNNAAVTVDGGEIGRAQALQAKAAKIVPSVHMNPVLLKPETTTGSQVVIHGKRIASMSARDYFKTRTTYMPKILESFDILEQQADLILVEGAGSPAEVNLRTNDIANMGFALAAKVPVLLLGDIHRGGVIASIVGTKTVLTQEDANQIKAFAINNFHGDITLFDDGARLISDHTGWHGAGVIPHFAAARNLPAEDALALEKEINTQSGTFKIAVPRLSRIANFDDLDPLGLEEGVQVEMIHAGTPFPIDADLILIPGTKATIADMAYIKEQGWDIDIKAHARRGGLVLGICGGYQLMGKTIADPHGLEGAPQSVEGLGLLEIATTMTPQKSLHLVTAKHVKTGKRVSGFEMHIGETEGADTIRPFAHIGTKGEGACDPTGRIAGTYLHGLFADDTFRVSYLNALGIPSSNLAYDALIETTLDALADHLENHLDLDALLAIAAQRGQ